VRVAARLLVGRDARALRRGRVVLQRLAGGRIARPFAVLARVRLILRW